jgi:hypothetical protein
MLTGKVLHVVTLTRIETGSAWKTEDAAVRLALEDFACDDCARLSLTGTLDRKS